MRMKNLRQLLLSLALFFTIQSTLQATDIQDLHHNDATGRPAAPWSIGKTVTVTGVITAPSGLFSATTFDIYMQDSTAGINVYSSRSDLAALHLGDLVSLTGTIGYANGGMTYIKDPSVITLLAANQPLPEPLLLDCATAAGSFHADLSEPDESRLIRVNNVHVTGANSDVYTISDATGTIQLYLDPDAHLPVLPNGPFDLIGLLNQYDPSVRPPKKAGYRIMPRFSSDIISRGAPLLVQPLQESAIEPTAVELSWQTDRPATSLVRFGRGAALSLGAAGDSVLTARHSVRIDGLEPSTLYRACAWSTDPSGTMISDTLLFITASGRSSGTIAVYFNQSIDASKAWREVARGQTDLSTIIVQRINQAKYSLDVHYYSFTHADIATALVNAKRRGVSVRFIADDATNTASNDKIRWLKEAGIPVIDDYYGANDSTAASHNKFVIIDHRDPSSGLDDYLWTGSSNASIAGATRNGENMLLIQDESLCEAYTIEFNEMWGSSSETPDPLRSRFGAHKTNNTPHRFNIGGRWIEQYMSPSDDTESHIIAAILGADHSLYFCILAFTQSTILNAMRNQRAQMPGFTIRGVFDRESVSSGYSVYADMAGTGSSPWSPPADVHLDILGGDLHHKYLLVDADQADSDPIVITGSHNWSDAANTRNDENTLIIHDRNIANLYLQEFSARYHESGGTEEISSGVAPAARVEALPEQWVLQQNYPNPFNSRTIFPCQAAQGEEGMRQLVIYNISGAQVARLEVPGRQSGAPGVVWEGRDETGNLLPTGIYFARLAGSPARPLKIILMR